MYGYKGSISCELLYQTWWIGMMWEASPHPVVPAGHHLLVQDLILVPLVHKLLRTVCSQMLTLNFEAMVVTSMRTTTKLSELVVVSLVL